MPKKKTMLDGDPPILVGGGGSSFIWIRKDLEPQLVDPLGVPGSAPQPLNPASYYCFKVQGNVGKIDVNATGSGSSGPKSANGKKFHVQFDF
ncbi:MAG TPA: hypothetical protein VLN44_01010 [Pyrinomonadaceae bacterium]|nr:hypothetical protein [Pyrinomonadaceae bacterium]